MKRIIKASNVTSQVLLPLFLHSAQYEVKKNFDTITLKRPGATIK